MSDMVSVIVSIMVVAVGAALAHVITTVAAYFNAKKEDIVKSIEQNINKSNNILISAAIERVVDIVAGVVAALNSTYKQELLEASADGKLSDEDKEKLRNKGIELIKAEVSDQTKLMCEAVIGNFDEWIRTLLENMVTAQKPVNITEEIEEEEKSE